MICFDLDYCFEMREALPSARDSMETTGPNPGLSIVNGTCTSCHDTPNVGNHSVALAINIGVTDFPALPALDIGGLLCTPSNAALEK
jgi:hypothetical protein